MSDVSEALCWVREMDDATAYMALALNNAQGELSPLDDLLQPSERDALAPGLRRRL
ncbi:MAG: hypothetical protein WA156_15510 [Methylocystis silviterrae]